MMAVVLLLLHCCLQPCGGGGAGGVVGVGFVPASSSSGGDHGGDRHPSSNTTAWLLGTGGGSAKLGSGLSAESRDAPDKVPCSGVANCNWLLAYKSTKHVAAGSTQGMDEDTANAAFRSCSVHQAAIRYDIKGKTYSVYRRQTGAEKGGAGAKDWKSFSAFELMADCWRSKQKTGAIQRNSNRVPCTVSSQRRRRHACCRFNNWRGFARAHGCCGVQVHPTCLRPTSRCMAARRT